MELETALGYGNQLSEGALANVGKMAVNGIKQAASTVSSAVNGAAASINTAAAKSDANAAAAKSAADAAKLEKVVSGGEGVSLKGTDKDTKALVAAVNSVIKAIDDKLGSLQAKESKVTLDDILLNRLQEGSDAKKTVADLTKIKDGLSKSLTSGILTAKGLQATVGTLSGVFGDDQNAKGLLDKLNKAYSGAATFQKAAFQQKATGQQAQANQASQVKQPGTQTSQSQNTSTSGQQPQQKATAEQPQSGPADKLKDEPQKNVLEQSQDVIKKCGAALGQITSSIDAIKSKNPGSNFGAPSKDPLYAAVGGDTYLDQVRAVISKVSSDLGNYALSQKPLGESVGVLPDLERLNEDVRAFLVEYDRLVQGVPGLEALGTAACKCV